MKLHHKVLFAAAATLAFSASAFAAESTVNVMLMGEGGGPMKIELDKAAVPAGSVTFNVANHAVTEDHEMVVIKLKTPDQPIPVIAGKHRIDEKKLKSMGEVADLKPSDSKSLKVSLKPGAYVLLCNIKGHYEAGMQTKFTVTN